jgi:hypothetical protein
VTVIAHGLASGCARRLSFIQRLTTRTNTHRFATAQVGRRRRGHRTAAGIVESPEVVDDALASE